MVDTLRKGAKNLRSLASGVESMESTKEDKEESGIEKEDEAMIGAIFPRIVRRSLAGLQTLPVNNKKTIKDLLGEALNDLFAKYNVPQTVSIQPDKHRNK